MSSGQENIQKQLQEIQDNFVDLTHKFQQIQAENTLLREQVNLLKMKLYGKSSERYTIEGLPDQLKLFDDLGIQPPVDSEEPEEEKESITVSEHQRTVTRKKKLPDHLPRHETVIDLPEEEKVHSCGKTMVPIGEEVCEKLHKKPAELWVEVIKRIKYACPCEGAEGDEGDSCIKTAPNPPQLLPKTYASASLMADILTSKFVDSLPFYRQEKQFARLGVELARSNMARWTISLWDRCRSMKPMMFKEFHSGPKIHIDETHVQVLCEQDRAPTEKSYMWVARGGPPDKPVVYFHYAPSRHKEIAEELLDGYRGIVQSDGYKAYQFLDSQEGVVHAGCWAHTRRKFFEATKGSNKSEKANKILRLIREMYKKEKDTDLQSMSPQDLLNWRNETIKPIIDKLKATLDNWAPRTNPKGLLGIAIGYTLNQWSRLTQYLEHAEVSLDNNRVENDIRPFVVGRKNWLFAQSVDGVEASAFFYSLIETAKANNLEPFSYLNTFFEKLPNAKTEDDYRKILPQYIDTADIKPLKQN